MLMNLNLEGVDLQRESKTDLVPAGKYVATIKSFEAKETASKQGHMLIFYFEIQDGEQKGKVFADRLNVVHTNAETQLIALSTLKTILTHGGHKNPNFLGNAQEVIGLTVTAKLVVSTFTGKEGNQVESNDVKGYEAVGSVAQGGTAVAPIVVAPTPVAPVVAAPPVAPTPAPAAVAPVVPAPPAAPVAPAVVPAAPAGGFPWGGTPQ